MVVTTGLCLVAACGSNALEDGSPHDAGTGTRPSDADVAETSPNEGTLPRDGGSLVDGDHGDDGNDRDALDASSDTGPRGSMDAGTGDGAWDVVSDASSDGRGEASADASIDAKVDATSDGGSDGASDAGSDSGGPLDPCTVTSAFTDEFDADGGLDACWRPIFLGPPPAVRAGTACGMLLHNAVRPIARSSASVALKFVLDQVTDATPGMSVVFGTFAADGRPVDGTNWIVASFTRVAGTDRYVLSASTEYRQGSSSGATSPWRYQPIRIVPRNGVYEPRVYEFRVTLDASTRTLAGEVRDDLGVVVASNAGALQGTFPPFSYAHAGFAVGRGAGAFAEGCIESVTMTSP